MPLRPSEYQADGKPTWTWEHIPAGEAAEGVMCGDVALIEGNGAWSPLIKRMDGSEYSHAVSVLDDESNLADMQPEGCVVSNLEDYRDREYTVIRFNLNPQDRLQASNYLQSAIDYNWKYGYIQFVLVKFSQWTGGSFLFKLGRRAICSGLAAGHMAAFGVTHPLYSPPYVTPGPLAKLLLLESKS